jgi:hypothetical protein
MGSQTVNSAQTGGDAKVKDALGNVRAAAQELHGAISDAVAKRGGATKAELEAFGQKIKSVTESAKNSMGAQRDLTKKIVGEAVTQLEVTQKHLADGMKTSGQAFQNSMRQVGVDMRASVQKISEAVAAERSATSAKH